MESVMWPGHLYVKKAFQVILTPVKARICGTDSLSHVNERKAAWGHFDHVIHCQSPCILEPLTTLFIYFHPCLFMKT